MIRKKFIIRYWCYHTLFICLAYIVVWACICFVNFAIYNPFQPLLDIPVKDNDYRIGILLIWASIAAVKWIMIIEATNKKFKSK